MNHSFNVEIATEYGILEAILFENISYWVIKNKANEVHFHDGYYWTYNSSKAFSEMFPYASPRTISRALHKLCDEGLIKIGNYNASQYDRTQWYTITEKGIDIGQNGVMHLPNCQMDLPDCQIEVQEMSNRSVENGEPIPDINTDINTDNITGSKDPVCRTDVQRAVNEWNKLSDCGIRPISRLSNQSKRHESLKARIREYGIEDVLKAIRKIRGSDYLQGKVRKWAITFDWFVLPNNFPKVLEGNYDNKDGGDSGHDGRNDSKDKGKLTYDEVFELAMRAETEEERERIINKYL